MQLDNLGIKENGDLCFCIGGKWNTDSKEFDGYTLMPDFSDSETCSYDDMENKLNEFLFENRFTHIIIAIEHAMAYVAVHYKLRNEREIYVYTNSLHEYQKQK